MNAKNYTLSLFAVFEVKLLPYRALAAGNYNQHVSNPSILFHPLKCSNISELRLIPKTFCEPLRYRILEASLKQTLVPLFPLDVWLHFKLYLPFDLGGGLLSCSLHPHTDCKENYLSLFQRATKGFELKEQLPSLLISHCCLFQAALMIGGLLLTAFI